MTIRAYHRRMDESESAARTVVTINDTRFDLHGDHPVAQLKQQIEMAVRAGGGFVEFTSANGHPVSILITPTSEVLITVELDARPLVDEPVVVLPTYGLHLVEDF